MDSFRVAISGDFVKADGTRQFPPFDLSPLEDDPRIELSFLGAEDRIVPASGLVGVDALILLGYRFTRASVPADGRLAVVARFGVGYDTVDLAACDEGAIACCTAPLGVRRPVAVAILTYVLALAGQLLFKDQLTRQGPVGWQRRAERMGVGLVGRTLGQLGMGSIGSEVFRIAAPLGLRFIAHDPYVDPTHAKSLGVELVGLEELFRQSDFLSVSTPLTESTQGLVGAELLALMKPSAYLINTSRGPVVDQRALYAALKDRRIAGAGLDVFEAEPAPADEPLLALDNVIVTPHNLSMTDQCAADLGATDIRAVLAVMRGEVPDSVVNPGIKADPTWRAKLDAYRARFG